MRGSIHPDISSKAPAIARAAAILRLLGRSETPLGVHPIARELGLVPSTCLYTLRALAAEELVAFDPETKRYALDAGILTLARHWLQRDTFSNLAQPLLDRISQQHQVTTLGVRIAGLDPIVVVAMAQSGRTLQLSARIGSRFPALISATGRCVAAFGGHADAEIEAHFHRLRWDTPPSFESWQREVAETRSRGWAVDTGNYIAGVTVAAAPVRKDTQPPSHALVAIGVGTAMRDGLAALRRDLVAASRSLSTRLGSESRFATTPIQPVTNARN